jgi:DNA primase
LWRSGCPYLPGGDNGHNYDRVTIFTEAGQHNSKWPHIWCRQCGASTILGEQKEKGENERKSKPQIAQAPKIEQGLAAKWHQALTPASRAYYNGRGISNRVVDKYKLGWNTDMNRYSIPCFEESVLWAIQYRRSISTQQKYISEKGSSSRRLFPWDMLAYSPYYVLLVEGPLDALACQSLGFPAIAKFDGNQVEQGWNSKWNQAIKAEDIIVIPDNDEPGELVALGKLKDIPKSRIIRLPAGSKDIGEFIQLDLATARTRIEQLIKLPPIIGV